MNVLAVTSTIRDDARHVASRWRASLDLMAGDTLLVTGSAGFLGAFLLDVIAAFNDAQPLAPIRVIALDNFITGLPTRIAHLEGRPDFTLVSHDMRVPYRPAAAVQWIVHAASIASPTFYRAHPLETIDVNVGGTRALLELARDGGVKGLALLSTSEIYGDPDTAHIPTSEDFRGYVACAGPRACYDESKRLAETLAWIYHQHYAVPVKVVRPFNSYGPGQRLDDGRMMPDMLRAALAGEPLTLLSDGRATRAFCYLRDTVAGVLVILIHGVAGEAYNVGNDEAEMSMSDLAERVARLAAEPPLPVIRQVSADPHYLTDNPVRRCPALGKLRGLVGWTPEVGLDEGIARALASYREPVATGTPA